MKTFLNQRGGEKREKVVTALLWAAVAALLAATVFAYVRDTGAGDPAFAALEPGAPMTRAAAVDINTASAEELDDLPGIGPTLAERIVAYREENGPFKSPEDVTDVPGIGPATYGDIAPYIGGETGEADP